MLNFIKNQDDYIQIPMVEVRLKLAHMITLGVSLGITLGIIIIASLALGFAINIGFSSSGMAAPMQSAATLKISNKRIKDTSLRVDYTDLNNILKGLIFEKPVSSRARPTTVLPPAGTLIIRSNKKMTRLESNRVLFHLMKDNHKAFVKNTRMALELLPDQVPLKNFSRNEQLAYWLNLRNIVVFEAIMDRYPIQKLKKFSKELQTEKRLTVAGQSLSVGDIEALIINKWPRQYVIYGFYNGSVGGPNLRTKAFTGNTVWTDLEENAKEFMGSLRGVQFRGKIANIATLYESYPSLFPEPKESVRKHLMLNLPSDLRERLQQTKITRFRIKDWNIADLMNGVLGLSTAGMIGPAALVTSHISTVGFGAGDKAMDNLAWQRYPEHVQDYLRGMQTRMIKARGKVFIEDVDGNERDLPSEEDDNKKKENN